MKIRWLALPIMAVAVWVAGSSPSKAYAAAPQEPGYGHPYQDGWDAPPAEYRDVQRKGFHDGIEAARKDFDHHRTADMDDHNEYRHPHVDASLRDDYREGFRRGYDQAMRNMMGHSYR